MNQSERFLPRVGTLAYLWNKDDDTVLLVRRNRRPDDDHFGKVNGLGGKVERNESIVQGLRRELREEAQVELTDFALQGTVTWSNFGPRREDWLGFMFLVTGWTGTPPTSNVEGDLEWVPRQQVLSACRGDSDAATSLPMWPGDHLFVPLVLTEGARQFHGTMPYDGAQQIDWNVEYL